VKISTPDSLFPRIEQDWCALKTGLRAQNDMKKADFIKKNPFSIRIFLDYWQVAELTGARDNKLS